MTVFGLGNPTDRYADTRHNVGFMVVDRLARQRRVKFRHVPGRFVARTEFAGKPLCLVKPLLYMNESGVPVREHLAEEPDDFLVVCDDLALPFGRLRLRAQGSDGGHNGLGSIVYHLETELFARLRIGIDPTPEGMDGVDYVLEPFSEEQRDQLPQLLDRAAEACLAVASDGIVAAMNRFNPAGPEIPEPEAGQ
jgi:PTH1 family peptidyl-tRNA hydrolase